MKLKRKIKRKIPYVSYKILLMASQVALPDLKKVLSGALSLPDTLESSLSRGREDVLIQSNEKW